MNDDQTIYRVGQGSFTTISNVVLHDDSLSFDAVGLLCRIMSLPQDWKIGTAHLRKKYGIGRDKLYRMIDELKEAGYMRYAQPRDEGGRMKKGVYYIAADPSSLAHIEPLPENPDTDTEPLPEKPDAGISASRKTRTHTKETEPTKKTDSQKALTRDFKNDRVEGIDWRNRLVQYRKRAIWPPKWGPQMHQPGCLIPAHLVKEWDETQGAAFAEKPKRAEKTDWTKTTSAMRHVSEVAPAYNRPGTSHD